MSAPYVYGSSATPLGDPPIATFLADVADVLHRTAELSPVDVALGLAAAGVLVLPTVPGGKDPLLTVRHIHGVDADGVRIAPECGPCLAAGLRPTTDHGATTDLEIVRGYWSAHADAGVGMKNDPRLVRGDGDFADRAALRKAMKMIGYGQPLGVPLPCEAPTPGGQYRRRFIHSLPEGVMPPGGGTRALGVSWYGSSGYVVVKGGHPGGGTYGAFHGEITPLPETVVLQLRSREHTAEGAPASMATDAELATFLDQWTGTARLDRLADRRRAVATAAVGDRHHTAAAVLTIAFREAIAGFYPARVAHDAIHAALGEAGWDQPRFDGEWSGIVRWAVGQVQHLTSDGARAAIDEGRAERLVRALDDAYPSGYHDAAEAERGRDIFDPAELDAIEAMFNAPSAPVDRVSGSVVATGIGANLPEEFWVARPELELIRVAAHSRGASPDAVLGCVLARVAAFTSPSVYVPPIVGAPSSLSLFVAVIGPPASSKTNAYRIAGELLRCDRDDVIELSIGTGEGLMDAYFSMVPDPAGGPKAKPIKQQTRGGVLAYMDEGQALAEMGKRNGTTILPVMRSMWTGALIGSANASAETRRKLDAGSYVCGLVLGFQPSKAAELLGDHAGGTPQRFEFVNAVDPSQPEEWPIWDGRALTWTPPERRGVGAIMFPQSIDFPKAIRDEVRARHTAVTRATLIVDTLDAHAQLAKMKVAALLAILNGRTAVTADDWELATTFKSVSRVVRSTVVESIALDARKTEAASTARAVRRVAVIDDDQVSRSVERMSLALTRACERGGGTITRKEATQATAGRDRQNATIGEAIDHAVRLRWVSVNGDQITLGTARPT